MSISRASKAICPSIMIVAKLRLCEAIAYSSLISPAFSNNYIVVVFNNLHLECDDALPIEFEATFTTSHVS